MGLNDQVTAERPHIAFFGLRNAENQALSMPSRDKIFQSFRKLKGQPPTLSQRPWNCFP